MEPYLQSEDSRRRRSISTISILLAALTVIVAGVLAWVLLVPSKKSPVNSATVNGSMSPTEQAYLPNIKLANITLSRAENFIHQEVTIVNGDVYNTGDQAVFALRLTIEFRDEMNQIVLRETRAILSAPLAIAEHRAFEISFDHVPSSWNMRQPEIRVAYLQLSAR